MFLESLGVIAGLKWVLGRWLVHKGHVLQKWQLCFPFVIFHALFVKNVLLALVRDHLELAKYVLWLLSTFHVSLNSASTSTWWSLVSLFLLSMQHFPHSIKNFPLPTDAWIFWSGVALTVGALLHWCVCEVYCKKARRYWDVASWTTGQYS